MNERDAAADMAIVERCKPAARAAASVGEVGPHGFDEDEVRQAAQDGALADTVGLRNRSLAFLGSIDRCFNMQLLRGTSPPSRSPPSR